MVVTVESYLKENIDDHVMIKTWSKKNPLPAYLREIYNPYEMIILDTSCILLEIIDEVPRADAIQKHIKRIGEVTNYKKVLYFKNITGYRRKSLIYNRIPFIIEDGQMFLPFLSLDLKKTCPYAVKKVTAFSVSEQKAYLYFLYNKDLIMNATDYAKTMRVTPMTASRTLNRLYDANLFTYKIGGKTGRSKEYKRIPDPEYFEKGKVLLRSPIKEVIHVRNAPNGAVVAGLEALGQLSMLNKPEHPIRAISRDRLNQVEVEVIENKDIIKDEKLVELQIWEYEPKEFSDKNHVDIMSLYASLKVETDERVEQALEEVLRGETWYTG